MKYMKRAGIYKASNVSFNPSTEIALSYNWWIFVKRIQGKLVFNSYRYSVTTAKHQSKVRGLLNDLNQKIDLEISSPGGLQDLDSAVGYHTIEMNRLYELADKKGTRKTKNLERKKAALQHFKTVKAIQSLMVKGQN